MRPAQEAVARTPFVLESIRLKVWFRSLARGLALGHVFREDGALAITVMQEGLIRPMDDASAEPA